MRPGDYAIIMLEPGLAPQKKVPERVKIVKVDGREVSYVHQGKVYRADRSRLKLDTRRVS